MMGRIKRIVDRVKLVFSLDVPPGHFYSPINDFKELQERQEYVWSEDIDFNTAQIRHKSLENQFDWIKEAVQSVSDLAQSKSPQKRFYLENGSYSYFDAYVYYAILLHYKPRRVIEVGCGMSSALLLDLIDTKIEAKVTFIDPYPHKLLEINNGFRDLEDVVVRRVQDVPLALFRELEEEDILFIDSSHISKTGSDLNFIIFEVLPRLKRGVIVHFHDIFYPFEYPQKTVMESRRSWNEIYLLRAFLSFNEAYRILFFNNWVQKKHGDWFKNKVPMMMRNNAGGIWLEVLK